MQFGERPKNHKTLNFDRVKLPHETTSKNLRESLKTPFLTTLSTLFNSDPFYYISMLLGGKANESDYQKNYYDEIDYQQQNNYDLNKSQVGPNIQAYNMAEEVEYQKNTYDIYNSKFGGVMPATAQQAYTGSLLQIQQMQAVNMADEIEYQKNVYDIYNSKIQPAVPSVAREKAHRGIGDAKKKRRESLGPGKQSAGTGGHDEAMNLMQDFTSKMWAADVRQAAQQPVPEHVAMAQPTYEGEHFDEGQAYRGMKKDVGKKSAGKKSK